MKLLLLLACSAISTFIVAQASTKPENIFIITTDGFRWQEIFNGADYQLISNEKYTKDTALTKEMYWNDDGQVRRKMLMPFFWNVIAQKGQLYGNRLFDNKMNMKNLYKISYPGYNEIFTGYADKYFIPNTPVRNRNINILEYLNQLPAYKGKVAAFTSWNVFPYILNEKRSKLPVNSGYEALTENADSTNYLINEAQANVSDKNHTRHDMLTYLGAREYLQTDHPRILFLGLGETDESAHGGRYDHYLQQASMVDKMIADLWYYVQTDPFYKDNTTFIITTDHGRGKKPNSWHTHSLFTGGSGDTWLAMIGPGIAPFGEIKYQQQTYANQLSATIAFLLGEKFETTRLVGEAMDLPVAAVGKTSVTISR